MIDKIGRNDPCPCGSGKKYKKCCLGQQKVEHFENKNVCDFCGENIDGGVDYTRTQTIHSNLGDQTVSEKYCSNDCKIASEIIENMVFMGFSSDLISHLRDDHGLTKNEIKAGVDRIVKRGDDLFGSYLVDWEKDY